MKVTRISQGGQIQVPAEVRRRWGTRNVLIEDAGSYIRIAPVPDDPIGAAIALMAGPGLTSDELRRIAREEEIEIEDRKLRERS